MGRVERISKPTNIKGKRIIEMEEELKRIQTKKAAQALKNAKN